MSGKQNGTGREEQPTRSFNPNDHLMQIKNRGGSADYLPVQWRLVWFNEQCPEGKITIVEKIIDPDREVEREVYQWNNDTRRSEKVLKKARGWAYFHVRVEDGKGKVGEAVKSECAVDFDDYIEKADTGATGRALAKIGYGTQFAPELDEQHRIVDAPVDRAPAPAPVESNGASRKPVAAARPVTTAATNGNGKTNGSNGSADASTPATEQQLSSLRKLCQHLGKPEPEHPDTLTYLAAKELITQLSHEYNEQRQSRSKAS
ncbi:MAG TPA: hypothetical protein VFA41_13825 [Ktedonobacteraceae bacterium]|jgi:hypothetical protein|nr:hypothetical protein [Ktedonobacteraceae bacterium]